MEQEPDAKVELCKGPVPGSRLDVELMFGSDLETCRYEVGSRRKGDLVRRLPIRLLSPPVELESNPFDVEYRVPGVSVFERVTASEGDGD